MAGRSPRDLLAMERGMVEAGPPNASEGPSSVVYLGHTTAGKDRALLRKSQAEDFSETSKSTLQPGPNENGRTGPVGARRYVEDDHNYGALPPCQLGLPIP